MYSCPAPAKINLYLKVTGRRDDGMHELDTAFVYVDIADRLTISPASELTVSCSSTHLQGRRNLVYRVLAAIRETFSVTAGLDIHIEKHIPEQAGLGGGSSDAATAIMAANAIWQLGRSADELIRFAAPFGADIPCFLFGRASAAGGIGDQLSEYPRALPDGYFLLACPGNGLSTAEVFRHFDARAAARGSSLTPGNGGDTIRSRSQQAVAALGDNDLESSAAALSPQLGRLLQRLRKEAVQAWMSGSGTACVARMETCATAETLAARLKQDGLAVWTHVGKLQREHPMRHLDIGA
ncbi:MAG: 4-(cytidine 5'-diphospho)-2-C-methyl-D-erythritol kinase [Mariprofundaceae bacterium]|nr:4-(cytidine 5'-diphospho)-2-C-methyl-D-erythritol kinase [Mariprofundaceae bacterium]